MAKGVNALKSATDITEQARENWEEDPKKQS